MRHLFLALALMSAVALVSAPARADFFDGGHWRLQVAGSAGINFGDGDRSGDFATLTTVEYEVPFSGHLALGLKIDPLFTYSQDDVNIDGLFHGNARNTFRAIWDDANGGDSVWGGGVGIGLRVYQVKEEQRGIFLDLATHALIHDGEINHDSSNIDFMSGLGLGYQFKCGFNTQLRFDHISNSGLGNENRGANLVGLAAGFRF